MFSGKKCSESKPPRVESHECETWHTTDVVQPNTCNLMNDGFFHSFYNFSKSNAFGKNFMRMQFILQKIFFRMSTLSSRKTSCMFFNLHSKITLPNLLLTIITHDGFSQFFLKIQFFSKNWLNKKIFGPNS